MDFCIDNEAAAPAREKQEKKGAWTRDRLVRQAEKLAEGHGRLVFLTYFGSALYGTRCSSLSDLDVRGIYVPDTAPHDQNEVRRQKGLHESTGSIKSRNTADDVDIDLYPFERWLDQLGEGVIGALDLLFAPSSKECTILCHPALQEVFDAPLSFLDLSRGSSLERYCQGQGNSCGLAGTRLGAIWRASCLAARKMQIAPWQKAGKGKLLIRDIQQELAAASRSLQYCSPMDDGGILLAGSLHTGATSVEEFVKRTDKALAGHRERIELAHSEDNQGVIDWKALSHACRAIWQVKTLLKTGTLSFPLACADELKEIRLGRRSFAEIEDLIEGGLCEAARLRAASPYAGGRDEEACREAAKRLRSLML